VIPISVVRDFFCPQINQSTPVAAWKNETGLLQNLSEFCNTMKLANSSCGGTPQSAVSAANACERNQPDEFRLIERLRREVERR